MSKKFKPSEPVAVDSQKLSRLVAQLFENLADLEEEILTYRTLVSALQQVGKFNPSLEEQREAARPGAKRAVDEKYAPIRKLLGSMSEGQKLLEVLSRWKEESPDTIH